MIDNDRLICYCNNLTVGEIVQCIKENHITTLEELVDNQHCPLGDKCETCHEDGYENDGYSLAMVLSLVKQKRL